MVEHAVSSESTSTSWRALSMSDRSRNPDPAGLVVFRFKGRGHDSRHPSECAICYEAFRELEEVKAMPCASDSACPSVYHADCIEKWLIKDPSCPLCRRSFPHLDPAPDTCVPLMLGYGAPIIEPPPITNPLRINAQERFVSARALVSRYRNNFIVPSGSRSEHVDSGATRAQSDYRNRGNSITALRHQLGSASSSSYISREEGLLGRSRENFPHLPDVRGDRQPLPRPLAKGSLSSGSLHPIRSLSELLAQRRGGSRD